jgi:hypothetical protein
MAEAETDEEGLLDTDVSRNRTQATLAILPFLALGLADVLLLLFWGLDPLWGFVILPPILFISVLGWIGFRSGFINDRVEGADPGSDADSDPEPDAGSGYDADADADSGRDADAENVARTLLDS